MVSDDWCICPNCKFTHSYEAFLKHLHAGNKCDMCNTSVPITAVNKMRGPNGAGGPTAAGSRRADDSKDYKDGGPGGAGDDGPLTAEMQQKIREREAKNKGKKEEALNTEDL
jgi:hypothetical protein